MVKIYLLCSFLQQRKIHFAICGNLVVKFGYILLSSEYKDLRMIYIKVFSLLIFPIPIMLFYTMIVRVSMSRLLLSENLIKKLMICLPNQFLLNFDD